MLPRLLDDHDRTREACAELLALIGRDQPCPPELLADCRWRVASLVLRHLPVEDRHVYQRLESHPDAAAVACAERFKEEREVIYGAFQRHSAMWTPETVAAGWEEYRSQARRLINLLLARLDREERELYPLLAGAPETTPVRRPDDRNWAGDGWTLRATIAGR